MTKDELRKLQLFQFEMLKTVHNICEKNDIDYYLAYGTLLGAARHKGSIPWDNDVDIFMKRQDYLKLVSVLDQFPDDYGFYNVDSSDHNYNGESRFFVKNTKCYSPFHGEGEHPEIHIDIFVLDNAKIYKGIINKLIPKWIGYLKFALLNQFEKEWLYDVFGKNFLKKLIVKSSNIIGYLFDSKTIEKHIFNLTVSKQSDFYITICDSGKKYPKKIFDSFEYLEYEGIKLKAPIGYDKFLTISYGDYMKLPDEKDRFTSDMDKFLLDFGDGE